MQPGDTPDMTQFRSDRKFSPEELHKLFGCHCLRNYAYFITAAKNGKLAIGGTPPSTLGNLSEITKMPKVKTLSHLIKFLQVLYIYIV